MSSLCARKGCQNSSSSSKKQINFIPCPQCKTVKYCSESCITLDKSVHQIVCRPIVRFTSKKTMDDYDYVLDNNQSATVLGKGAYGEVKLVKEKATGALFALKTVKKSSLVKASDQDHLVREIRIQRTVVHPNVIRLFHAFEDAENIYVVLEYAEKNNLFMHLSKKQRFSELNAFIFFIQTCLAVDCLHKIGIIHRDIKPENLLVDHNGNIKLCDFGWCGKSNEPRTTFCGTTDYLAPEIINRTGQSAKTDIWCLGILLYEMIIGEPPFYASNMETKLLNITKMELDFPTEIKLSEEVKILIRALLNKNPIERPNISDIFNFEWINQNSARFQIDLKKYVELADESSFKGLSKTNEEHKNESEIKIEEKKDKFINKSSNYLEKEAESEEEKIEKIKKEIINIEKIESKKSLMRIVTLEEDMKNIDNRKKTDGISSKYIEQTKTSMETFSPLEETAKSIGKSQKNLESLRVSNFVKELKDSPFKKSIKNEENSFLNNTNAHELVLSRKSIKGQEVQFAEPEKPNKKDDIPVHSRKSLTIHESPVKSNTKIDHMETSLFKNVNTSVSASNKNINYNEKPVFERKSLTTNEIIHKNIEFLSPTEDKRRGSGINSKKKIEENIDFNIKEKIHNKPQLDITLKPEEQYKKHNLFNKNDDSNSDKKNILNDLPDFALTKSLNKKESIFDSPSKNLKNDSKKLFDSMEKPKELPISNLKNEPIFDSPKKKIFDESNNLFNYPDIKNKGNMNMSFSANDNYFEKNKQETPPRSNKSYDGSENNKKQNSIFSMKPIYSNMPIIPEKISQKSELSQSEIVLKPENSSYNNSSYNQKPETPKKNNSINNQLTVEKARKLIEENETQESQSNRNINIDISHIDLHSKPPENTPNFTPSVGTPLRNESATSSKKSKRSKAKKASKFKDNVEITKKKNIEKPKDNCCVGNTYKKPSELSFLDKFLINFGCLNHVKSK